MVSSAVDEQPWAVGQATLASMAAHAAVGIDDNEEYLRVARSAISKAKAMAPRNAFVQIIHFFVYQVEIQVRKSKGLDYKELQATADPLAEVLLDYPEFFTARRVRGSYFYLTDRPEMASREIAYLANQGLLLDCTLSMLLNFGYTEEKAARTLISSPGAARSKYVYVAEALSMAQTDRRKAIERCNQYLTGNLPSDVQLQLLNMLLLLGDTDGAQSLAAIQVNQDRVSVCAARRSRPGTSKRP